MPRNKWAGFIARLCRESLLTPCRVPMLASSCREELVHPGGCLAASAGSGAEPQGSIANDHPYKTSPYLNIRTSNRVITLITPVAARIPVPGLDAEFGTQAVSQRTQTDRTHGAQGCRTINGTRIAARVPVHPGAERGGRREGMGGTRSEIDGHAGRRRGHDWRRSGAEAGNGEYGEQRGGQARHRLRPGPVIEKIRSQSGLADCGT